MRLLDRFKLLHLATSQQVHKPRYTRLGVEILEDRCVPTGLLGVGNPAVVPAPNTRLGLHYYHQLQQAAIPTPGARVAFVGDSILYRFQHGWGSHTWQTQIAPLITRNISIEGNTTAQTLWEIHQGILSDARPDVIVLMIGVNNLSSLQKPEDAAEGVGATVHALRVTQPQAHILLLSILPTFRFFPTFNYQIYTTNNLLSTMHDGERVHFLDLTESFITQEGNVRGELFLDSVHPNSAGYSVLASSILPSIRELLPRSPHPASSFPLVGDWDGNGVEGIALVDVTTGYWYLRNDFNQSEYGEPFQHGLPGWVPLAGDWDGDGDDDIGTFDPHSARWYLRNDASPGPSDAIFEYGLAGWRPVTGDWDGDGRDSVGVLDPVRALWLLRNESSSGEPDAIFQYGQPDWWSVTGDWDNDGRDEVGTIDSVSMIWYLDTSDRQEEPEVFAYGGTGWQVFAGDWDGNGKDSAGVMDLEGNAYLRDLEGEPLRLQFIEQTRG